MIPDGYRIIVHYDSSNEHFVALVPEIPGIQAMGDTRHDALNNAEQAIEGFVRQAAEAGREMPTPIDRTDLPAEISLRLSPGLHRELRFLAAEEGIDAAQLASEVLSLGIGLRLTGRFVPTQQRQADGNGDGHQRPRGRGQRKDYHSIMDDRASFIEYVRSIDAGGKRPTRPRMRRK